ncbi:multiprotein-bridging factor 1 family protein [Streptomyces sp. NPDC015220]|uniref:helix-turn-helix domain-containing protein n=1 Tax=Streptomyces sp. NPDC015220 TaxID=3364947 RepID=UPI0036FB8376
MRLLRTSRGLTRAELGAMLGYGEDMIASVELGRRIPRPEFIDRADAALGAGGLLVVMKDEVARARYPAFFRDAAALEPEAVELHVHASRRCEPGATVSRPSPGRSSGGAGRLVRWALRPRKRPPSP